MTMSAAAEATLIKLQALTHNMQVRLTREEREARASQRNAAETEQRCKVFKHLKQGAAL
jgi:hypothetical protein